MLPRLPRRTRRTLTLVVLGLIVFFAGSLKDLAFGYLHGRFQTPEAVPVEVATTVTTTVTASALPTNKVSRIYGKGVQVELQPHHYRKDGLLDVNPDGPHPIFELIERAEEEWNKKIQKSSKTIDEAVTEYQRRYQRLPPKGFEDWWSFVEDNNVLLPDEYDSIHYALEPFWGMHPNDLSRLESEWEGHEDTYTLGKTADSPINIVNFTLKDNDESRITLLNSGFEFIDLLEDVQKSIPPFRAVFSPHDNPNLATDWGLKETALRAAARGQYIDVKNPPPINTEGWISACPPGSPARLQKIDHDNPPPPPTKKSFIYDHRHAMDPCLHPNLFYLHGQFLSHFQGPVPHGFMPPQFSYCGTSMHHDIIPANPINFIDELPPQDNPDWEDKLEERLLWRGTNTGMWHDKKTLWQRSLRIRLMEWANGRKGTSIVIPPPKSRFDKVGRGVKVKKSKYNPAVLDIHFTGEPGSCAEETCETLMKMFEFRGNMDYQTAGRYKYVLDVDGNGWSSRFKRLITSKALVFKATVYPEWFTERIQPWLHYVPVQIDLSDLADSLSFFRGDINGEGGQDELAQKIAMAGRQWSRTFWREQDMTAYLFRMFLEYARVMSPNRNAMTYSEWDSASHW